MRWKVIIILMAITLGILVPPSLPVLSPHGTMDTIGILDVCHCKIPTLFKSVAALCVNAAAQLLPLRVLDVSQIENQHNKPCLIAYREERPPKTLL